MTLGEIIKDYRETHHMSQRRFATLSGLSNSYISMLEANENTKTHQPIAPSLSAIMSISQVMGVDPVELILVLNADENNDMSIDLSENDSSSVIAKRISEDEKLRSLFEKIIRMNSEQLDLVISLCDALVK